MNKYISLSKYPGRQGFYYYSEFFKLFNIDAEYTPIGTENLQEEISRAKDNDVKGISVSMPFKQEIIKISSFASLAYNRRSILVYYPFLVPVNLQLVSTSSILSCNHLI